MKSIYHFSFKYLVLPGMFLLNSPGMAQPDFYHLLVHSNNAELKCTLNGFPVYATSGDGEMANSIPVHLYLVGSDNELKIAAKSKNGLAFTVEVKILPYQKGDIASSDDPREGDAQLSISGEGDEVSREVNFDNERFDFSKLFVSAPELTEEEIVGFGEELYAMLRKRKVKDFVAAMQPKVDDYAAAFSYPAEAISESLENDLGSSFFKQKHPDVEDVTLSAVSHCGNRVWELRLDDHEFLYLKEEDGSSQMPVYVAKVEGNLAIVR